MMKFSVVANGRDTKIVKNTTVQRITVTPIVDVIPSTSLPLLNRVFLKITLNRNGKSYVIMNDDLQKIALSSCYFTALYGYAAQPSANFLATGASQWEIPLCVDFGCPINVTGTDELIIEVRQDAGWYGTSTAASYIQYVVRDTIGNSSVIPVWVYKQIQAGQNNWSEIIGDNCAFLGAFSSEVTAPIIASTRIYENIRLESDKMNLDEDAFSLISRRLGMFELASTDALRYQSWVFLPEVPMDKTTLVLQLKGANVTANNVWIASRVDKMDSSTLQTALERHSKHQRRNSAKVSPFMNK